MLGYCEHIIRCWCWLDCVTAGLGSEVAHCTLRSHTRVTRELGASTQASMYIDTHNKYLLVFITGHSVPECSSEPLECPNAPAHIWDDGRDYI